MAYDNLSKAELAAQITYDANQAENAMGRVMRKSTELGSRISEEPVPPPAEDPDPLPDEDPVPGDDNDLPTPQYILTSDVPEIADNFDASEFMHEREQRQNFTTSGLVAAFRLHGKPSHLSFADPMFVPKGKSTHGHLWWGNDEYGPDSTYESLRTTGNSTVEGDKINRSGYGCSILVAETEEGELFALVPEDIVPYYKQEAPGSPFWEENPTAIRAELPRGLRMVGGIHHYEQDEWHRQHVSPAKVSSGGFEGWGLDRALEHWQPGGVLVVEIVFPDRWDGKHSATPNNKDHMRYGQFDKNTAKPIIEESHPYVIPTHTQKYIYRYPEGLNIKRLWQSSDLFNKEDRVLEPGESIHAYFFDAWSDEARRLMSTLTFANAYDYSNGRYGPRPGTVDPETGIGVGPALTWRQSESNFMPPTPVPYYEIPDR